MAELAALRERLGILRDEHLAAAEEMCIASGKVKESIKKEIAVIEVEISAYIDKERMICATVEDVKKIMAEERTHINRDRNKILINFIPTSLFSVEFMCAKLDYKDKYNNNISDMPVWTLRSLFSQEYIIKLLDSWPQDKWMTETPCGSLLHLLLNKYDENLSDTIEYILSSGFDVVQLHAALAGNGRCNRITRFIINRSTLDKLLAKFAEHDINPAGVKLYIEY